MANQATIEKKKQQVEAIVDQLKGACAGVIVDYKGINVADDTVLRKELREAGVKYNVVKNTILNFAVKEVGLDDIAPVLNGTTAIATSENDYIAAAKILCKFAESHDSFSIKLGFSDGKVVDAASVESLAKLPSREGLISMLLYTLNEPIAQLARVADAAAKKLEETA